MACSNCLQNCDPVVTDKCVKSTIGDIEELGICKNTSLFEVNTIILDILQNINENIKYSTFTSPCSFVTTLFSAQPTQPLTLQQFGELVLSGLCQLKTSVTAITPTPFSFNTSCLTGTLTTRDEILQGTINKVCSIDTRLEEVEDTYVQITDLCAQVTACLPDIPLASTQWNSRMVPYAPIPYIGPLSNFDNTGKGISANGFDKVYLMNGLNGTSDWRGRSPIGAIQNVPGATLDTTVDPSLPANLPYNYSVGTKTGASSATLTLSQTPSHSHTITDPGHYHFVISNQGNTNKGSDVSSPVAWSSNQANGNQDYDLCKAIGTANAGKSSIATTGITLGSVGSGQAHTNLHPVVGCLYIVYIP